MVRLLRRTNSLRAASRLVSIPQWCDCCSVPSQSTFAQYRVSIPQWCDCCPNCDRTKRHCWLCFNPTMVRLLPEASSMMTSVKMVSIPQWCDCCAATQQTPARNRPSFNPTMVRLLPSPPTKIHHIFHGFNPTMVRLLRWSHEY